MTWQAGQYEPVEVRRLKNKLTNLSCKCSSCYQTSVEYSDLRLINMMSTATLKDLKDREVQCKSIVLPNTYNRYVDIINRTVLLYMNLLRRAGVKKKVCKDEGTETTNSSIKSDDKSTGRSIKFLQKSAVIGFGPEITNFLNNSTFVKNRLKDKACATLLSSINKHNNRTKRRIKLSEKNTSNIYRPNLQSKNSKFTSSTDLPSNLSNVSQKKSNLRSRVTFLDLPDSTNEVGYKTQCVNCLRLDNIITSLEPSLNKKMRRLVKHVMASRFSKSNANTSIPKIKIPK